VKNDSTPMRVAPATWAFFAAVAVVGTLTTAFNTISSAWLPQFNGVIAQAALRHDSLYMAREWVLLVHAPATFFPMVGLVLALWRCAPAGACVALSATAAEKFVELLGQTVRVFVLNPVWREQLATGDAAAQARAQWLITGFGDVWNSAFFVLWLAGAAAALAVALMAFRSNQRSLAVLALAVALLGVWMTAVDYLGFSLPMPDIPWLYPAVMITYRALIAYALWQARQAGRSR
jgi:hypothetical protein